MPSLYRVLADVAPANALAGETLNTREKETIDRDVEAFFLEDLIMSETSSSPAPLTPYEALGEPTAPGGPRGDTRRSSTKETVDDDREVFDAMTVLCGP
jgi:hypothetical protein